MITQKELVDLVFYNPVTGKMYWEERGPKHFKTIPRMELWNEMNAGREVGRITNGYLHTEIGGKYYYVHRLVFLYMTGSMPDVVDHVDGDKSNNTWSNLRNVTQSVNCRNRRIMSNNSSGFTGVSWSKSEKKWQASICHERNFKILGSFDTIEGAINARRESARSLGFTERHIEGNAEDIFTKLGYRSKYDCLCKLSERFNVSLELVMDIDEEICAEQNIEHFIEVLSDLKKLEEDVSSVGRYEYSTQMDSDMVDMFYDLH